MILFFFLCISQTVSWGGKTHRVIAHMAAEQLSDETKQFVLSHLGGSDVITAMEDIAEWADRQGRALYAGSDTWHYVTFLDESCGSYIRERDCVDDQCIVGALTNQIKVAVFSDDKQEIHEALKFIIHFVGDIHQPLHLGHDVNRNGNSIKLQRTADTMFLHRDNTNLHSLWDIGLPSTLWLQDMSRQPDQFAMRYAAHELRFPLRETGDIATEYLNLISPEDVSNLRIPDLNILGDSLHDQIGSIAASISKAYTCRYAYTNVDPLNGERKPFQHTYERQAMSVRYIESRAALVPSLIKTASIRLAQILNEIVEYQS